MAVANRARAERIGSNTRAVKGHALLLRRTSSLPSVLSYFASDNTTMRKSDKHRLEPFRPDQQEQLLRRTSSLPSFASDHTTMRTSDRHRLEPFRPDQQEQLLRRTSSLPSVLSYFASDNTTMRTSDKHRLEPFRPDQQEQLLRKTSSLPSVLSYFASDNTTMRTSDKHRLEPFRPDQQEQLLRKTSSLPSVLSYFASDNTTMRTSDKHTLEPSRLDQQEQALQYDEKHVDDAALARSINSMPEERLTKLNPLAEEFFPAFQSLNALAEEFLPRSQTDIGSTVTSSSQGIRQRRNRHGQLRRQKARNRIGLPHMEQERIRRTVYVSNISCQVQERQLSAFFMDCGEIVDCRICGVNSRFEFSQFAFVEFTELEGAHAALSLSGEILGDHPIKVLRSKTGIVPVNPIFLPTSEDEKNRCERTIYCTNIDRDEEANMELFFQYHCGEILRLRVLEDHCRSTLVAFVEFVLPESAVVALNCSGVQLGSLPIRVRPSKTPVWLPN